MKRDIVSGVVCALAGLFIAVIPHIQGLILFGTADFLADGDDVLYLAISRAPYYGSATLVDPFEPLSTKPTLYPWLSYVPGARIAAALDVPLLQLSFLWRIVGGLAMGGSLFVLFRTLFHALPQRRLLATAAALFVLADPGVIGRPFIALGLMTQSLVQNNIAGLTQQQHGLYRVTTPLLVLPVLILLIAILIRPLNLARTLLAAALLALLIYLYFFLWTAAVATLTAFAGCYFLLGLLRREERRGHWQQAMWISLVVVIGVALGAPQILSNSQSFADPALKLALDRMSRGVFIPAGDPIRTMYLKNVWAWGALFAGTLGFALLKTRGVGLLWLLTLMGFALRNSALVTGLEFENYHWNYVHSPSAELLLVTMAILLLDRLRFWNHRRSVVLLVLSLAAVVLAITAHWQRCRSATEARFYRQTLSDLAELRPALNRLNEQSLLAGPKAANVALLFTRGGQLYQFDQTSHSSLTPDREVHERYVLNAWLSGRVTEPDEPKERFQVSLLKRPEWEWPAVDRQRQTIRDELQRDGGQALLQRYPVTHLLTAAGDPAPISGGPWTLVAQGQQWSLWQHGK
ncbi:hypothetical protein BH11PLA2_BH11PLA2_21550 [soil metagenome]